ncbi:MAG: four-carbon acid sugar kinase family protein, partial [Thermomicrobiaceae bacterium]|nr:four-carbon acid sugar kinase family protein [Thermomicrobiaceae bacterium]
MVRVAILADDLTGAADSAAPFAAAGASAAVALDLDQPPEAEVLALSTESRRLS